MENIYVQPETFKEATSKTTSCANLENGVFVVLTVSHCTCSISEIIMSTGLEDTAKILRYLKRPKTHQNNQYALTYSWKNTSFVKKTGSFLYLRTHKSLSIDGVAFKFEQDLGYSFPATCKNFRIDRITRTWDLRRLKRTYKHEIFQRFRLSHGRMVLLRPHKGKFFIFASLVTILFSIPYTRRRSNRLVSFHVQFFLTCKLFH